MGKNCDEHQRFACWEFGRIMIMQSSPPCGFHPRVSILYSKLERYLSEHPKLKAASWYVPATKPGQEQRHDNNPIGWWEMQLVNGDVKSGFDYVSNRMVDPQFRFAAHNIDPIKAVGFLELLDDVLMCADCCRLGGDGQYVTAIRRSSITLPVVFRPKIQRTSAMSFYEFALKRDK
jgi:hypothetical protein